MSNPNVELFLKDTPRSRRERLPIDTHLRGIVRTVEKMNVVVVEAETGAGKTLRIAQAVNQRWPQRRVVLTQPRRNACRWNGARIAYEMGVNPGDLVGWRLAGEKPVVSKATKIELVVDQTLVNRIRCANGKLPEGIMIIDEAHERSVPTDMLLGLIKEGLPKSPNTTVIITSATIDTEKFSRFFDGAPVVSVPGRCFPVTTEIFHLGHREHHSQCAARVAHEVLSRFSKGALEVPSVNETSFTKVEHGVVIVLLPGKEDILNVMDSIQEEAEHTGLANRIEVMSCHGGSTPKEQNAVQEPVSPGCLRFVCGTEILRSSVTILGTIGVIDSLQVKRNMVDAKGVAHLQKIAISSAEAKQACGRAGRTAPGFYIPVSFGNEFHALNKWPQPAVLREPITNVTLQVAGVGRSVRNFSFIDVPQAQKMEVAIRRLQAIGALDEKEEITERGKLLLRFPIDPERARVLITAEELGVLPEAVVVTAVEEAEGIFHFARPNQKLLVPEALMRHILSWIEKSHGEPCDPADVDLSEVPEWALLKDGWYEIDGSSRHFPMRGGSRWVTDSVRRMWAVETESDFVAIVNAYRAFKDEEHRLQHMQRKTKYGMEYLPRAERDSLLRKWCFAYGVNMKRVRIAERLMRQIREDVHGTPLRLENGFAEAREFDGEALTKALASGLVDNVARRIEYLDSRNYTSRLGEFSIAYQSACLADHDLILTGHVRKVADRRGGHILLADTCAPLKPEWLVEIMPHLCSFEAIDEPQYSTYEDCVVQTENVIFQGDLEIACRNVHVEDQSATHAIARWLARSEWITRHAPSMAKEAFEANLALKSRAELLNARAGQEVFDVWSTDRLTEHYEQALEGACRFQDVQHPERLALPAIDRELEKLVLEENPDTIMLLEEACEVQYPKHQGGWLRIPRVHLEDSLVEKNRWPDLPDTSVKLPSGQLVEVCVSVGHQDFVDADIPSLKEKIDRFFTECRWRDFEKPEIAIPDHQDPTSEIPFVSVMYGASMLSGEALRAYGTACIAYRMYQNDPHFRPNWFFDHEKAETTRDAASEKLVELKAEAALYVGYDEAVADAMVAEEELIELRDSDVWSSVSARLRSRAFKYIGVAPQETTAEVRAWGHKMQQLIGEIKAVLPREQPTTPMKPEALASVLEKFGKH